MPLKTEIILILIAAQVVYRVWAKRKAKQAEAAARNPAPNRPADESPVPAPVKMQTQGKAAEMGKDLLSQLAKELGLEIPAPAKPRPAPQPAASAARPNRPDQHAYEAAKRIVQTHTVRPAHREGGGDAPRRAPGNMPVTVPEGVSVPERAQESLSDAESIQRAFILKTILDKPLSLRPRLPGEA